MGFVIYKERNGIFILVFDLNFCNIVNNYCFNINFSFLEKNKKWI